MVAMAAVLYALMSLYFIRRNKARRDGNEAGAAHSKSEEEIAEMGDENPRYMFTY
jgi:hypothetical protein